MENLDRNRWRISIHANANYPAFVSCQLIWLVTGGIIAQIFKLILPGIPEKISIRKLNILIFVFFFFLIIIKWMIEVVPHRMQQLVNRLGIST